MSAVKKKKGARAQAASAPPEAAPEALTVGPPSARPRALARPVPPGWHSLEDEPLPRPTAWPAALAFAVTFLLWGIVSSPFITGVGLSLLVLSIAGWIGDIRNEARSHH